MTPETCIDFARLLRELAGLLGEPSDRGPAPVPLGTRLLAADLGVGHQAVRCWLDGVEPSHTEGEALLRRWREVTGMEAPRKRLARQQKRATATRTKNRRNGPFAGARGAGAALQSVWGMKLA